MNIGLPSLSYCAIMGVTYIIFYGLSSHLFKKIKIYYEIALGFIIGVISIFAIMAATKIADNEESQNFVAYLQILIIFICGIFISAYTMIPVAIISMILIYVLPTYIPDLFFQTIPKTDLINLGIVIFAATVILTIFYFIKHKWSKSIIFLFSMTVSEVFFLIILLVHFKESEIQQMFSYIIWFGAGYVLYAVAYITDRVHNHAIRLRQIIEEEDEFYISSGGVKEKLKLLISKDHVRHGFLFSYFITQYDLLDQSVSPAIRDFIWQNVTGQIKTKILELNPDAFFFHENYKVNGFFIPSENITSENLIDSYAGNAKTDRLQKDMLRQFSNIFESITLNYNVDNYRISIKLRAVCSIYGIHSSNLDRLIENNGAFILNKDRLIEQNQIYLVNPKDLSNLEYEGRKLKTLNSITQINSSSILYEPIYNMTEEKIDAIFLNYLVDGNVMFPFRENREQIGKIMDYGLYTIIFRFLAFKALKEAKENLSNNSQTNLFLFYDSKYISSDLFSASELNAKIKKTKIKRENIVLVFDTHGEIENPQVLAKNIVKLKGYGIKIAMMNFTASKFELAIIPHYQPDYLIIDQALTNAAGVIRENKLAISGIVEIAKKIEAKVIANKVKSFIIYKTLKSIGVDEIFGEIIGSSTQFKDSLTEEQMILLHK
jgi:EAL domain-containing protein (putative c-di-GMP-specific phosphodiesterase class I)